ncbi:MAG: N-acetylmuramoyl-L-alanine amidase, partial [Pseudomonadota bacterium]|nr:N-acetylmuramoyl-L-alanine amidase [Pseudomonadota bacterium]
EGAIRFHPQPRRSAALKVLRAPDVPSVLFESGFITNEDDAARLASAEGQARFAEVMARAIRVYFARQQES